MKYLNSFDKFLESTSTKPDVKPKTKPGVKPRPQKPGKIVRPSVDPDPKAEDVADRFISLMNKKGESVEKYI